MDELIIKIKIISKPLSYWQTNDPIIPLGQAAHVTENAQSQVRIGDGKSKWSVLTDKNIDMSVPPHQSTHAKDGKDPLSISIDQISDFGVATDAQATAGTATDVAVNPKQLKTAVTPINTSIASINTSVTSLNDSVASLNTSVTGLNTSVAALGNRVRDITISSAGPSGGKANDIWLQYIP